MGRLWENSQEIRRRIDAAAIAAHREPRDIRLLTVSKTFPASDIAELYGCGVRAFGESRIPELEAKAAQLPADIEWHFIGQLQSNKVRKAVKLARVIHSVDSVALIERIDRIAAEENTRPQILLEINISGEASKSGAPPEAAAELCRAAFAATHLTLSGLMTMAPADASEPVFDAVFGGLAALRNRLVEIFGRPLPELSMGMSGDFPAAIARGATIVRVGSAIFGRRS